MTVRITTLNALRKAHPALASGSQTTRLVDGNVLAFSRFDKNSRTEYLVAINSGSSARSVKLSTSTPNSGWQNLLSSGSLTSSVSGELSLTIPARSTLVYKAQNPLPVAENLETVSLNTAVDSGSKTVTLSAGVTGVDLGTVSFAVKENNGPWTVIGSDDSRGFGMTWDYGNLAGVGPATGSKLSFVAIYKSTSGTISVSAVKQIITP